MKIQPSSNCRRAYLKIGSLEICLSSGYRFKIILDLRWHLSPPTGTLISDWKRSENEEHSGRKRQMLPQAKDTWNHHQLEERCLSQDPNQVHGTWPHQCLDSSFWLPELLSRINIYSVKLPHKLHFVAIELCVSQTFNTVTNTWEKKLKQERFF